MPDDEVVVELAELGEVCVVVVEDLLLPQAATNNPVIVSSRAMLRWTRIAGTVAIACVSHVSGW